MFRLIAAVWGSDLAHGQQLRRGPDDRGGDRQDGRGDLGALAEALFHEVGEGHHFRRPQLVGEEEGHPDQADRITERIGAPAGEALIGDGA